MSERSYHGATSRSFCGVKGFNVLVQITLLQRTFVVGPGSDLGQPFRPRPKSWVWEREREKNVLFNDALNTFYLGYMASDIWLRTILIVRKETRCRHIGYSYRLTARVLLYAPSHRQDNTYHGLCYTSRGALAGTRNSSTGPPHEGSIRRPIAP